MLFFPLAIESRNCCLIVRGFVAPGCTTALAGRWIACSSDDDKPHDALSIAHTDMGGWSAPSSRRKMRASRRTSSSTLTPACERAVAAASTTGADVEADAPLDAEEDDADDDDAPLVVVAVCGFGVTSSACDTLTATSTPLCVSNANCT